MYQSLSDYKLKIFSVSDLWVSSHEKLSDFYASSWQRGESPLPLLVVRLALCAAALAILVWAVTEAPNPYWLIFLTNWGLLLITAMTISGTIVSLCAVCKKIPEEGLPPWYVSMYWLLFNISVPIAVTITLLYWILLFDSSNYETRDSAFWLDMITHGFNSALVLAELLASRTPLRFAHVYQPLGLGLWYAAFTGIYYASGGTDGNGNPFIYGILSWANPGQTTALVAASTAGVLVVYTALWGLTLCRDKVTGSLIRTTSHDLPYTPPDTDMLSRIV
ncbi:hypothetical protein MSG28_011171 [Choristoneura fumiferana]|uniref:Uncharacterized protein n=1 Tax=Choristoneura fumiferana TaxID=7141 RepID=A0ACC0KR70_CHOFU|nr:hypothetical protein MSG28_011171 [Choristoneura fumiferana]